ncbi:MAG: type IV CRISPR-associated protein Csf2 [Polaromonas sp.]|nr:type IV CRISPR-associated protein Csf2 [Polaromonas sp.]
MDLIIRGVVTTTSLCHQTSPEGKGTIMTTLFHSKASDKNEGPITLPYISANSVRGLLRREAAEIVLDEVIRHGVKMDRNLYLSLVRGSFARTGLASGGASYKELAGASAHTFAGLFGGGAYMYRSPMRLERDLLPVTEATKHLMPTCVHEHAIPAGRLLSDALIAPKDDFARLPETARAVIDDLEAVYAEHMATKATEAAATLAAKDSGGERVSNNNLDNFATAECIVPGVPLYFGISARGITEPQAGLLLSAVLRWCNRNALGGGSARGRGSFLPKLSLWMSGAEGGAASLVTDNLIVGDSPMAELAQAECIQRAVQAMQARLVDDAKVGALEAVYPIKIEESAKKAAKKAKAAKSKTADAPTAAAAEA